MADIRSLISKTSAGHVLRNAPEIYVSGFVQAADEVYPEEGIAVILQEKFGIPDDSDLTLDRYLQSAAELSVQNHLLLQQTASNVQIEKQVNPPKNVDVYYEVKGVHIALEVKCPVEALGIDGAIEIRTAGRVPSFRERFDEIKSLLQNADPHAQVNLGKNKDNTLKDFLLSAHSKFRPECGIDDLNMLLVACGEPYNINCWYGYLKGEGGFFTANSTCAAIEFSRVDVVVLSNLKYAHTSGRHRHDWTLRDTLLLPVPNPAGRRSCLSSTVISGLSPFDHHMGQFGRYQRTTGPNIPDYIRDAAKVIGFVGEELSEEERLRYFPPPLPTK